MVTVRLVGEIVIMIFSILTLVDLIAQTPLTQYFLQQGARMYAFASSIQRRIGTC